MGKTKSRQSNDWAGKTRWWTVAVVAPAIALFGCASAPEPEVTQEDLQSVEERVENAERNSGRLMVRLEEMERQMALVQDRVESNRIALQRQGYLGRRGERFAEAPAERPDPAPESNYRRETDGSDDYRADPTMDQRMQRRGGTRIPLSDRQSGADDGTDRQQQQASDDRQYGDLEDPAAGALDYEADSQAESTGGDDEPIVITNETLEERFGSGSTAPSSTDDSSSEPQARASEGGSATQVPVTGERLPTTDELDYEPDQTEESEAESESTTGNEFADASDDDLLDLYQDSLADYRAGDYSEALEGFTRFLDAGPRDDYVDNALYWIGECHYGLGEYEASVEYFTQILDELPSANKVPDAMLKKSLAFERLGKSTDAVDLLEELTDRYPNTNPGRLGEERLEEEYADHE